MSKPHSTIIVVEDDADEAALLRDLLERRGYRVVPVANADQCLDHVAREPVDLVITGIQMPGISGVELCRALNTRYPQLLVIVLSGSAERARVFGAIEDCAFAFMTKPVKLDVLDDEIKRALASAQRSPTRDSRRA